MKFVSGQALKAGAEADFQLPSVDTPDDIVAGFFFWFACLVVITK